MNENTAHDSSSAANHNFRQAELDKFGALAQRWWGESPRVRATGSRGEERTHTDVRAGAMHHGRFEVMRSA